MTLKLCFLSFFVFQLVNILPYAYVYKKETFDTEFDHSILNYLDKTISVKSKIICVVDCLINEKCGAATYISQSALCSLYKHDTYIPYTTEKQKGTTAITRKGTRIPLTLTFDPSTLYSNRYLSPEHTILSNELSSHVQAWPNGNNQFSVYPGVSVDNCVLQNQKVYYEFYYEYTMNKFLTRDGDIAIEFGIADIHTVGNAFFSGSRMVTGWSFPINRCPWGEMCLEAWTKDKGYFEIQWSRNIVGHFKSGNFIVIVDRIENKLMLMSKKTNSEIFTFSDVIHEDNLCPVFSIQSLTYVNATIILLDAYELH